MPRQRLAKQTCETHLAKNDLRKKTCETNLRNKPGEQNLRETTCEKRLAKQIWRTKLAKQNLRKTLARSDLRKQKLAKQNLRKTKLAKSVSIVLVASKAASSELCKPPAKPAKGSPACMTATNNTPSNARSTKMAAASKRAARIPTGKATASPHPW
jgi:hypothetical protein